MDSIPDSSVIIGSLGIILTLIKYMHNQVIKKLDDVVKSNAKIRECIAVHSTKLESTANEFAIIREHQKYQDERIATVERSLIQIQNH